MRRAIGLPAVVLLVWATPGWAAPGVELVKDIVPGSGGSGVYGGTDVGGSLYFAADDGTHGDKKGVPSDTGTYLWHFGTGNLGAHGDAYCQGFWYIEGRWYLTPPPVAWPAMQGEGRLWGTIDMKLSHANIQGGWIFTYEGEFIWDLENNMVWAGSGSGDGYGALEGWEIALDVYKPYYPPVAIPAQNPGGHEVWTGYVIPPADD